VFLFLLIVTQYHSYFSNLETRAFVSNINNMIKRLEAKSWVQLYLPWNVSR